MDADARPPAPRPAAPGAHRGAALRRLERWERIGLAVRLALHPQQPGVMRLWVGLGERLAADGLLDERAMWRRTLQRLLQVALDEALPLAWRCMALDHAARPAVRLAALAERDDPVGAEAVRSQLDVARERLDAAVAFGTTGRGPR